MRGGDRDMDFFDFALGFVVGANVAWFICDRLFRKRYEREEE